VAVSCHYAFADHLNFFRAVLVKIERVAVRGVPRPGQNMPRIAPDEMRCFAVRIDNVNIRSVGIGGEHSRAETTQACCPPAMQKDESRAFRIEQQVVKVVLGILWVAGDLAESGYVGEGYNQFPAARIKIDSKDAGILRSRGVFVRVRQASVTVAGSHVLNTPEIRRHGSPAIGANGINWVRQGSFPAAMNIKDVAYEPAILPVVEDNLVFRAGPPLEHAALLPAPCAALAEFSPPVAVFQIDHPDFDDIVGFWAEMLEVDLHPEHVPAGRVELQFVVVAEPVEFRPLCDSPDRRQALQFRLPIFDFRFG